ncbi:MAG: uracil-DNA glycosylase [Patescibacteria group bacterium]|mgnify:CR=1 FL=1
MSKIEELKKIKEDIEADKNLPLVSKPEDVIPGDGNPDAKIVFIGEAGGYHESIQRKPFVGQAGKLLDKVFVEIGIERKDVYISNMVKTRPPENRDPTPEELSAFGKYLDRELEIIKPKVVVTLGRFSMGKFLPFAKISSVHGKVHKLQWKDRDIVIVPMYHPAAALRNGNVMAQFREDFLKLPEILKEIDTPEIEQMNLL